MKTSIPLALALCVATVLATVAVAEINQASKWDFFYLVRQWPASFCNDDPNKCKRPTPNGVFTIHGFWPNRKNGSYPANCDCAYQLDYYQVKDLQMELESVWPSYTKPSSKNSFSFWNYEWIKHGTCAKDILGGQDGQKKYFQQALRLHRELSIEAALKKAGINLVSGQDISTQDIKAAIKNAYGVKPVISCEGNGELKEVIPISIIPLLGCATALGPAGVRAT
eukprot:GHUV01024669.1.p1 GENE.GHUV01024669.1~~GHUV01024669.1.p1  ORF type:complete len:224 (+),score=20.13 GHUV01024669.1:179-850(+)